jgi:hypothetical protein
LPVPSVEPRKAAAQLPGKILLVISAVFLLFDTSWFDFL